MFDDQLTRDVQMWLECPREERDLERGALLLLRLNRNRFMHKQILHRRNFSKLEYELQKHLKIRLEGLTAREVARMEQAALPMIEESLSGGQPISATEEAQPAISTEADHTEVVYRGKRADHDTLPADVQALYERNGEIYFRMKQLFETLKGMENATACDRHELLTQLVAYDREYREGWNAYDSWTAATDGVSAAGTPEVVTPQQVSAARKFLSVNLRNLSGADAVKSREILQKMQERVDLLLAAKQTFDPGFRAELEAAGLVFCSA